MVPLSPIACVLLAAGGTPSEARNGMATVAGALTVAQVDDTVREQEASTERCARAARGASGIVVLGWQVSPEGAVTEAVVISTTLSHPEAESCLRTAIGVWRFPATDSGVTLVSYPFVFGNAKLSQSTRPLPRAVIDSLILERLDEVTDCGEDDTSGILEFRWSVAPWGHVTGVGVLHSELSRRVIACVAEKVASWRFPPSRSRESVDVSYCFVFKPYGSDEETPGGGLDGSAVDNVVSSAERMILGCYENELASTPDLAAEIEVIWTIAPSGRVSSVAVAKRTIHHPGLERCLLETVSGWRFPAFTGEPVKVAYPFYFAPL